MKRKIFCHPLAFLKYTSIQSKINFSEKGTQTGNEAIKIVSVSRTIRDVFVGFANFYFLLSDGPKSFLFAFKSLLSDEKLLSLTIFMNTLEILFYIFFFCCRGKSKSFSSSHLFFSSIRKKENIYSSSNPESNRKENYLRGKL